MKNVPILYLDGACVPNPGYGAWCGLLKFDGQEVILKGTCAETTNNRMEMWGLVVFLQWLKEHDNPQELHVVSDSQYLLRGIDKPYRRKNLKNPDLWQRILSSKVKVTTEWVRGHSGHPQNEFCNEIVENLCLRK